MKEQVSISIPQFKPRKKVSPMHKIPVFLRRGENSKFNYDPIFVSLGPYHHKKEELQLAENFKPKSLELFAARSAYDTDFYFNKVLDVIHDVRRCYVENSTDEYEDDVFAKMMLHDASFIINFMFMEFEEEKEIQDAFNDHLGKLNVKLIFHDISLLENQIPFWFLQLLIHLRFGQALGDKMLDIILSLWLSGGYKVTRESNNKDEEPLHLLELYRNLQVVDFSKDKETNNRYWFWNREELNEEYDHRKYFHSFRSVTDLKAKGIHFKRSCTHSFRDVKFKSLYFYAELQLPAYWVTKNTKVLFLNMIAFEMCPNSKTNPSISSYINFLKTLIESPKDVKELREKEILYNMLGSDEELLQVFKEIDAYGVDDVLMFYDIRKQIQDHYNSLAKTWLAELFHIYFRSPWSIITWLAAIVLLYATLVQTYFTVYPCFDK